MIHGCKFRGQDYVFHQDIKFENSNVFTLVVGKNGVGKSVLLQQLINFFVPFKKHGTLQGAFRAEEEKPRFMDGVEFSIVPSKIIASSTSPFDKFPIDKEKDFEGKYEYLGLKGLPSDNLSLAFISKTFSSLIKAINDNQGHLNSILRVFDYLGYAPYMKARIVLDLQPNKIREIIHAHDPANALISQMTKKGNNYFAWEGRRRHKARSDRVTNVLGALDYFVSTKAKPRIDIVITEAGALDCDTGDAISSIFSTLLEAGLLNIRDVTLRKNGVDEEIQISDASSGEQCVLMALLGIASKIENDSIVFIDEPEVCLHPEWQEKYIELLMESFSDFNNCHFIIATHSPQIVSNLASDNCFVLDMQKGETVAASEVNRKSADFQLASVFGAPGFKNEYLSREIISALATLGGGRELSTPRLKVLRSIVSMKSAIDETDPVYKLIELLADTLEEL